MFFIIKDKKWDYKAANLVWTGEHAVFSINQKQLLGICNLLWAYIILWRYKLNNSINSCNMTKGALISHENKSKIFAWVPQQKPFINADCMR